MQKTVLLFTFLICCVSNTVAQKQIETEEYSIYNVLLENSKQSVVSSFTVNQELNFYNQDLSLVKSETRKNYNTRNQKPFELQSNFDMQLNVNLVTTKELRTIFDKLEKNASELTVENALIEKYGSGTLISFSRVGFNKGKNQALVYVSSNTGLCGTCSTGYFFILSKEKGHWAIKKKVMGAIS